MSDLESRVKKLEEQINNRSQMFGRSYSQVGTSESDFLIKTKGQLKVQYGSKFIDLIKDGKLNQSFEFVFPVKDESSIGARNGFYITNDNQVFLKYNTDPIKISSSEIPSGVIVPFHGETIPEGWVLCDGNNNTPNLIGKFIKANNIEEESQIGINSESEDYIQIYSLVFIMKI